MSASRANAKLILSLDNPEETLRVLAQPQVSWGDIVGISAYALAGLAVRAQKQDDKTLDTNESQDVHLHITKAIDAISQSGAARFAVALGFDAFIEGKEAPAPTEQHTVPLTRLDRICSIDKLASQLVGLLIDSHDQYEAYHAVRYVLIELMRNVRQHSGDIRGGVIVGQVHHKGTYYEKYPSVQIAVADGGIGIPAALQRMHPKYTDAKAALEKSLQPHISGTFVEGLTGSLENAGMGLFFISEMTKLIGGRLLIATRNAGLFLSGDPEDVDEHQMRHLVAADFAGTLVGFEVPLRNVYDFDGILNVIRERAAQRTPRSVTHRWMVHGPPPEDHEKNDGKQVKQFLVSLVAEDTASALQWAQERLLPCLFRREPVCLDFRNIQICTQSFLHSLLFEALRVAWALRVPVYVVGVEPAVRVGLELVENYALAG